MELYIALLALIASATADVSHLSREYLPPVQHYYGAGASSVGNVDANIDSSIGTNAATSDAVPNTNHHHQNAEYAQQFAEVPVLGRDPITYGNEEQQPAEPVATSEVNAASSGPNDNGETPVQYNDVAEQQVNVPSASEGATDDVGAEAGVGAEAVYDINNDLSRQDALGVQDFSYNILLTDNDVDMAAAQGPAVLAPRPVAVAEYVSGVASAPSGIDTHYAANGGYIY